MPIKEGKMKVRLLTALGILVFGLPLLLFSKYIVYPIALGVLSAIAAWEMLRAVGLSKKLCVLLPSVIIAALLPFFTFDRFFPPEEQKSYILIVALAVFVYLLYLAFISVVTKGSLGFKNVAAAFMCVTYSSVAFTSLGLLRYMPHGVYIFELVFIGAWVCDSFAYFTGILIGKHKLIPELSPKKTVEGAIGGTLFTVVAFLLYGFIIEYFFPLSANYLVLGICGFALAVVAQVGDLFASLIKRESGIKDYSRILPGHGGIMDRFDSILAVTTVLMIIATIFPIFTQV